MLTQSFTHDSGKKNGEGEARGDFLKKTVLKRNPILNTG
jgi:hypothetical protein